MSDLYDDLGVPRDASEDEIRKAYRKRAKKDHPDAGGEPGAFERIQRAVAVLSDPDKRARYDETGDAEESDKPDMAQAEALALIQQVLTAALSQHDPDKTDIVGEMRKSFENARRAATNDVNSKRQQAARFLRLAKKATAKGKRNILAQLLEGTARDMERAAANAEQMVRRFTLALEMISDASWEFTPPPSPYTGYMADPTQANMQQGQSGLWFFR